MDPTQIPIDAQFGAMPPMPPSLDRQRGPAIQPDAVLSAEQAIDEFMARAEEQLAPKYPSWLYKTTDDGRRILAPPRHPKGDEFEDWIHADMLLYGDFLRRVREDLRVYRGMTTGAFPGYNPDSDDAYWTREIAIQVNKIMAMIAGSPHRISWPWRTHQEQKDAAAMEDFSMWFVQEMIYQHRAGGNSSLFSDMAWYGLVVGRIATYCHPDLTDGDFPWWVGLVDPCTCFPIYGHGKRGMIRVSREYAASLADVLDQFDPDEEKKILRKIYEKRQVDPEAIDLTMDVRVNECVTRWHRYTSVDGIELENVEHELGVVPLVYNLGPGEAGTSSMPFGDRGTPLSAEEIKRGTALGGSSSKARDYAYRGQSFFHNVVYALRQKSKLLGLHMLAAEQAVNPATQTQTPYENQPPEPHDNRPGRDNQLRPGEQRTPAIPTARPIDSEPLLQALNAEASKALLPDQVFGHTEGSNITGFASDTLIAAALDIVGPQFDLVQNTVNDTIMLAVGEFRNFGHLAEGLSDGQLIIPRQNRGSATGAKSSKLPPYAQEVLQTILAKLSQPGMPLGPPAPPPSAISPQVQPDGRPYGGGGMIGSDVPGAPPGPIPNGSGGVAPIPASAPQPPALGGSASPLGGMMGGLGGKPGLIGMPGFVDPMWTIPASGINSDEPIVYISREVIDNVSGRPKFTLNNLSLNNKTVLINYLTSAVDGKLMPRSTAMAQLPENDNVVEAFQRILAEEGITNPEMLKNIYYPRALAEQGDMEGWLTYWVTILLPQMLPILNPAGMMGAGGSPPGGTGAGSGGGQAPIEQPGNSVVTGRAAAQLGRGPGSQGQPVGAPG